MDLVTAAPDLEELDLTAEPAAEGTLSALVAEDTDDLAALDLDEVDLVTEEDLVAAPLLDLVMEELLVPAVLDMEPIPLLVEEPVVLILGLYALSPPPKPMLPQ